MDNENVSLAALWKFFEQYFPLNLSERAEVAARFTERSVKRRTFILQQGDTVRQRKRMDYRPVQLLFRNTE